MLPITLSRTFKTRKTSTFNNSSDIDFKDFMKLRVEEILHFNQGEMIEKKCLKKKKVLIILIKKRIFSMNYIIKYFNDKFNLNCLVYKYESGKKV